MSEGKYIAFALACIIAVSGALMFVSSEREAAIMDELPHIPAGYSYVRFLDYRLNPEHPPLLKALAGVPLLFLDLNFPTTHKSWAEDINGQWDAGTEFLYRSGNDADIVISLARIAPMLLTLLMIVLTYLFAKEVVGKRWALVPALLFGLSPTVLAHGHYVTTDIAAAFGTLLATYAFTSLLLAPSWKKTVWAGLALGVAELMKFSNALLVPFFLFLALALTLADWVEHRKAGEERFPRRKWKMYLATFFGTCFVALALIYVVYFLFTLNYPPDLQARDTAFILESFPHRWAIDAVVEISDNPLLKPLAQYLLGFFMVLQRAAGGNTGYFLGEVSASGWPHYFPVVFFLKETIPTLIFVIIAAIFGFASALRRPERGYFRKFIDYVDIHFHEFAMMLFIFIYWGWTLKSNLNIGVRHLIPTIPFIYILATAAMKKLVESKTEGLQGRRLTYLSERIVAPLFKWRTGRAVIKYAGLGLILVWFLVETAFAFPHFISYFNQFGGGKYGGYRYVTDSNYDWGQDMKRLQNWVKENEVKKIAVDYFGGGNPEYFLGEAYVPWSSGKGNPADEDIEWLAVSVNTLASAMAKTAPEFSRNSSDEYAFLRTKKIGFEEGMNAIPSPDARAGTSIFIYKVK